MASAIRVRIVSAEGSTPREVGAGMSVFLDRTEGTIGGGRLEYEATLTARQMISSGKDTHKEMYSLGPQLGQCCGGRVELDFNLDVSKDVQTHHRRLLIFGGGHVGRALVRACFPLPFDISVIETREAYLEDIDPPVQTQLLAAPEAAVRDAQCGSCYIVTTHDHGLDFLVVEEALKRGDAAYIGMIGSTTKRAVLERQLRKKGIDPEALVCPIGASGLGDKRPEVIAAFTASELLGTVRETT